MGVGLRVADGTPIRAYQQSEDRWLDAHPDTGASLTDFRVPNWEGVLDEAVAAAAASSPGYAGVGVVLDHEERPRILEVNVRPGLGIRNTTEAGLLDRLRFVESLPREYLFRGPVEKRRLAVEWAAAGWSDDALAEVRDA